MTDVKGVIFALGRAIIPAENLPIGEERSLTPQVTSLASRRGASPAVKGAQARADKLESRRVELAEATLETLAELGYARTSLREIAQNSEFSHGVLHYYFSDKVDLICCGVRYYKAKCVTRYDGVVAMASQPGIAARRLLRQARGDADAGSQDAPALVRSALASPL